MPRPSRRSRPVAARIGRTAIATLAASALLVGVAACSSGASSSPDAGATLWGLSGTDQDNVIAPALKDWNAANPDKAVTGQFFANDAYKTKVKTAVGAGSAPTLIYSWAGGTLADYVKADKVEDLTESTASIKDKYIPGIFDQGVIDGRTYAVPMNATTPVLFYYNKDVLEKAGVEVPETFDDILAAIPKLKAAGVAPFSLAGGSKWPALMWEEYLVDRVAGPEAFTKVMNGEEGAWSDPGIIKANEMIQQLVDAGAFVDGFSSVTADSNADVALLYTGKAAMLLQGAWIYGTLQQQAPEFVESGLGFDTFPSVEGGKGDPANIVGNPSGYFSISADASDEAKETATEFLTDGVFDEAYTKRMLDADQVPPLAGIGDQISGGPDSFGGQVYSLTESAPSFQMSWDQALPPAQATALLTNLDQLFTKQITPEEFSDAMNATIGQ